MRKGKLVSLARKTSNSLHIQYISPTLLHLRNGGDGEKTKIGKGVKTQSGTLRSQGPTRIESTPPG